MVHNVSLLWIWKYIIHSGCLIYYDIQFLNSSKNLEWKKYITTAHKTLQKDNWYIQHRNNLGNESFHIKLISIIVVIFGTIQMILKLLKKNYTQNQSFAQLMGYCAAVMDICFYLGPMIISVIIFVKLPSFHDTIYIYKEMQL